MELFKKETLFIITIIFLVGLGIISYLDIGAAVGLSLLLFLFATTFLILCKIGIGDKRLYLLLLIVFLIHLGVILTFHYTHFQPFSGGIGDYATYHREAQTVSQYFRAGQFSLEEISLTTYYPLFIGIIYTITLPEIIIGELLGAWLAVLSVLFVFLIVREIGASEKRAFLVGLITGIYPSYLFYGSLLLKDTLVVPLVLAGLLFCLKLIKNFSWRNFLIFYIILAGLIHFRFYVGYALLFTFIFCWLLTSNLNLRKRVVYAIIIIPLLGFLPEISAGQGFYGMNSFKQYLNPKIISFYQEVVYTPSARTPSQTPSSVRVPPLGVRILHRMGMVETLSEAPVSYTGFDSSWQREKKDFKKDPLGFFKNSIKSFIYALLGPFPWQMKYSRHLFALFETIPWYFLFFFIFKGIIKSIKSRNKFILPLVAFSFIVLLVISVFFNNFGIISRIRIPAFISLLCLVPFGLEGLKNMKIPIIKKVGKKICVV